VRTSLFAFNGKNIDVWEIAEQLGVSFVMEGGVRNFHNCVWVTALLINSEDGTHFRSEDFARERDGILSYRTRSVF